MTLLGALSGACGAGASNGPDAEPTPRVLGSARRPDPTPWVPEPEGEGSPAATGEVAAAAPAGPHAAVRAAYVDFVRRLLASDWDGLAASLATQVGLIGRPQTLERSDVVRRLRQRIDRLQLQGARLEDVLEPREIRVRTIAEDSSRGSGIAPGDLQVTATPRLPTQRNPFGSFEDSPQMSLVFRREEGRWLIVAVDL